MLFCVGEKMGSVGATSLYEYCFLQIENLHVCLYVLFLSYFDFGIFSHVLPVYFSVI